MPNRATDELFQLIKSMEKSEKRNFKLYVKRLAGSEEMKSVQLFDTLDRMDDYDEELLLRKNTGIKKQQLSNIKAHLFKQLMSSLRMVRDEDNVEMFLNEQLGYARILYNKGLYMQSLKILEKVKQSALEHNQTTFRLQAVIFEKKIEALHITHSRENRAELLAREVDEIDSRLLVQGRLSNLSLQLYAWYIKMGHARDEKDVAAVKMFFDANMPACNLGEMRFYEKMYYFQSYCWYYFILQDFKMYYRHSQKWLDLFNDNPQMIAVETGQYIKAFHNLLSAHFETDNYDRFVEILHLFEDFSHSAMASSNTNNKVQAFVYLNIAKINRHFMDGTFSEGLELVPELEARFEEFKLYLDRHRVLVFYYKIACLYFGSGDNDRAIDYLQKIINQRYELRTDLQCYARLLHLIAHYELGNNDILESLIKSVYRYMAKMKNLTVVEEEIFRFLRHSFAIKSSHKIIQAFERLKAKLEKYEGNSLESRSFMYLDINSWLESKIRNIPVQEVRRQKFEARNLQLTK